MHHPFKSYVRSKFIAAILLPTLFPVASLTAATTYLWTGASAPDLSWATAGNWNPAATPVAADSVVFGLSATSVDRFTVNNSVTADASVTGLSFTNSGPVWHVTQIPAGVTLTAGGAFLVGGISLGSVTSYVAMVDAGTFVATGTSFNIGNGNNSSGNRAPGILDLSGLSNFVYSATGGTIAIANAGSRSDGALTLAAASNNITASTINIAGATGTSSSPQFNLGAGTNIINVNTFNVGAQRASTTMQFANATGGLRLRGTGGTDTDRTAVVVGNRNAGGTGTLTTRGTMALNGHPVDMKISTLTVGTMTRTQSGSDSGFYNAFGTVQFDTGTVDANTINMGVCSGNSSNSFGFGTLTVGFGGTLLAGNISLVNVTTTAANSGGSGTLNVSGGLVNCTGNLIKSTGGPLTTGMVSVANSGTLAVGGSLGTAALPLDSLALTDANLTLRAAAAAPANITSLTTGGSTNVINISSVPAITLYPAQFQVLKYSGSIAGAGFDNNIGLGTLPASDTPFEGYISNNATTLTIDVVLTGGPAPAQPVTWAGTQSGAWDSTTLNWLYNGSATNYNNAGDYVTFDDTASTSTVYLARAVLTPGSITVSNSSLNYTFAGTGKLSGSTGLTKQGSGALVIDNAAVNDFAGPVSLTGTLQFGTGSTNGNLPSAASVANDGTLIFNRSDNFTVGNVISGSGAVVQNGPNTLTVSASNTFAGGLTANSGMVRLSGANSAGTGQITVNPGATVVLGAQPRNGGIVLAGGTLGSSATLNPLTNDLTAAASTASTIYFADPLNLGASDGFEMAWSNTLHGSGSILVATVTNDTAADSGNGFRLRGTTASDFSGTITFSNNVKGELQTAVAGPFSPAGTGKLRLWCGAFYGTNAVTGPTIGGYSEVNLRNNSSGDTIFGNDIELLGSGTAFLDPLGSAPEGSKLIMGNLKMGGGQELGLFLNGTPTHVVVFPTVTLIGGDAKLSPRTPGFSTSTAPGSDLALGDITETAPSGIIMNGVRTLTLTGNNSYSGSTVVSNGTLVINGNNLGTGGVTVYAGTLAGQGLISGQVTIAAAGTFAPGTSIGMMTIANTLTLAGTNVMELNKSGTVLTNDQVAGITTLHCGGTLVLNLSGDPLSAGDKFKLYSFTSADGAFTSISPAVPGTGLLWNTNKLATDGTLEVLSAMPPQPFIQTIAINGTEVVISGTNSVSGGNYYVLSSTNVALPVTSWTSLATQAFNGFSFSFTNAITPGEPQRFYLLQMP